MFSPDLRCAGGFCDFHPMNDDGFTFLPGGVRVRKSDPLICVLGSLDELNAALGLLRVQLAEHSNATLVNAIQCDLFRIGGDLATGQLQLKTESIATLEHETDQRVKGLPPLCDYIVPGENEASARCHWARAVCRRAERDLIHAQASHPDRVSALAMAYLNQLSSLLFAMARQLET